MIITVRDGNKPSYEIDLDKFGKEVVSFGRQSDCDIVLCAQGVSRIHGCFYKENSITYVEDMNSTNGIYSNGEKILRKNINEGDAFEIYMGGEVCVSFTCSATLGISKSTYPTNYMYEQQVMQSQPSYNQHPYMQSQPSYNQSPYMQSQPGYNQSLYVQVNQGGGGNVRCPKCNSNNLQVIQEQSTKGKDFSGTKGCCGALLLGPIGILCGHCGKGKQFQTQSYWLCKDCGNKFKI